MMFKEYKDKVLHIVSDSNDTDLEEVVRATTSEQELDKVLHSSVFRTLVESANKELLSSQSFGAFASLLEAYEAGKQEAQQVFRREAVEDPEQALANLQSRLKELREVYTQGLATL